jgi:hypothetical protein
VEAFFEGKTAMQLVSSTENSQILSLVRTRTLNVGIFPFPSARAGQPPIMPQSGYEGWAIPRDAGRVPGRRPDPEYQRDHGGQHPTAAARL